MYIVLLDFREIVAKRFFFGKKWQIDEKMAASVSEFELFFSSTLAFLNVGQLFMQKFLNTNAIIEEKKYLHMNYIIFNINSSSIYK